MAEVILERVNKVYADGVRAVWDLDLHVADGEFMVLVGPSGCGKSTTLRMIAGLEEITSGTVRIGGRVVNRLAAKDRNVAMVSQNFALYPHLSVRRNLAFGLQLRRRFAPGRGLLRWLTSADYRARARREKHEIDERVAAAAATLEIERLLRRKPWQLSGGERQRVALGRAIVREPSAFLLDEPLSNLDARLRIELRDELKRLHRRIGATMLYVTHDQEEAMTLGRRVVVLHAGRVLQIGTPAEIYERPLNRFVAEFFGTPPMNFIEGRLVGGGGRLQFESRAIRLAISPMHELALSRWLNHQVTLGIRPEALRPHAADTPLAARLTARVELAEPLGDRIDLTLRAGESEILRCRTDARGAPDEGAALDLAVDMQRAHYFSVVGDRRSLLIEASESS